MYGRREAFVYARMKCNRNENWTEDFWERISRKLTPNDRNMYRERLFRMLTLATYFKVMEISEVAHVVNNYQISF